MIKKVSKIKKAMQKEYGRKKGENAFKVKGVDRQKMDRVADKKFFNSKYSV